MGNLTGFEPYLKTVDELRSTFASQKDEKIANQMEYLITRLVAAEDKIFRIKILPATVDETQQTAHMNAHDVTRILYEPLETKNE